MLYITSVYAVLAEFPSASASATAHLTRLTNLLLKTSKGCYSKDTARSSIDSHMPAKSLELKHTTKLIYEIDNEIEAEIKTIIDKISSPILSIPGINYHMGAMIIAEIDDFRRFDSLDKILAYADMSPSTYLSGQLDNCCSHIEKVALAIFDMHFTTHQICVSLGRKPRCISCQETSIRKT